MSLFYPSLQRASDANNRVLAGAKWYFYLTGTTTPTNVYSNATLATSLGSVVTADSGGLFNSGHGVFLDETIATRAVLKTAAGATILDIDPCNMNDSSDFEERARDAVGAALIAGENITITVSDASNTITVAAPSAGSPNLVPSATGVFFDTAAGDLFTDTTKFVAASDATLTVGGKTLTFNNSGAAKALDCYIKDSAGNTGQFCFDNFTVDATYTVNSFVAADDNGVFTGLVDDAGGGIYWLYASLLKAHPGSVAQILGALWNTGAQLTTDGGGGFAFGGATVVRSQYSRVGNIATHTLTYPATADRTMTVTQVFAATSYETPRLFSTAGLRFCRGNIVCTNLKVSAGYANANYAFIGDSLTQGRNAAVYADGFVSKLRVLYPNDVINAGAPSATTANWKTRLRPVIDLAPRYAFICLGTNDLNSGRALVDIYADYKNIVSQIQAAGITPIVISVPPFNNGNVPTLNAWLSAQGWTYIDIYNLLVGTGTKLNAAYDSGDGLHWNSAGHNVVYGAVSSAIAALPVPAISFQVDTDHTMAANSGERVPSQSAVVGYVSDQRSAGTSGLGYGTGAGGTVTQATSKSTGVTCNEYVSTITLNNAALAADTTVSFTLTNSTIASTDNLIIQHISGGTAGSYLLNGQPGSGSALINVRNITAGSLSEAIVLRVTVIKGVTA